MSDKVWPKTHFRRGTKGDQGPSRDSAGNNGVLSGVPGCDHDYDDQNLFLAETMWSHLSWSTKECLSEC